MTTMTMFADAVVAPGDKFAALGSRFPFPFTVIRVNPVLPEFTIRERVGDETFERVVRLTVFLHAAKVRNLRLTPGKGVSR